MDLTRRNFLALSGASAGAALVLPYLPSGRPFYHGAEQGAYHDWPNVAVLEHYDGSEARWVFLRETHPPEIHVTLDGRYTRPFEGNTWQLAAVPPSEPTVAKFSRGRQETHGLPARDVSQVDRGDLPGLWNAPQTRVVVYYRQFAGPSLPTRNGEAG